MENWPLYQYVMSLFIINSDNFPCSEICFVWNWDCHPCFLLIRVSMACLSPSIYFNPFVPSYWKGISYRQHNVGSCFFWFTLKNLYSLIDIFRPLWFRVIIDIVGLIPTIFVTVFCLLFCPLFLLSSFPSLVFMVLTDHFIWFYFLSFLRITVTLKKNSSCSRVCNIHLQYK